MLNVVVKYDNDYHDIVVTISKKRKNNLLSGSCCFISSSSSSSSGISCCCWPIKNSKSLQYNDINCLLIRLIYGVAGDNNRQIVNFKQALMNETRGRR